MVSSRAASLPTYAPFWPDNGVLGMPRIASREQKSPHRFKPSTLGRSAEAVTSTSDWISRAGRLRCLIYDSALLNVHLDDLQAPDNLVILLTNYNQTPNITYGESHLKEDELHMNNTIFGSRIALSRIEDGLFSRIGAFQNQRLGNERLPLTSQKRRRLSRLYDRNCHHYLLFLFYTVVTSPGAMSASEYVLNLT